jgi:2-hydroxychromene-2-carboxylate isomerase
MSDVEIFVDPVCPFCWITSRWVVEVAGQRDLDVEWRFIALRIINEEKDYATEFPDGYPKGHGAGLRMLRVLAAAREQLGNEATGELYAAMGTLVHNEQRRHEIQDEPIEAVGDGVIRAALERTGLPAELAAAANDTDWDDLLRKESELALSRTGPDVGTPILSFSPETDDAVSFFGPVISSIPRGEAALELWDLTEKIARFPTFAELKRSLRERPSFD